MNDCKLTFIFPDFKDESTIEISLDGGITYPYSVADSVGVYEIRDLEVGTYNIFARHPGSNAVPMGNSCISSWCIAASIDNQPENSGFSNIHIFPNPANSIVKIEGLDGTCQIEIFDIYGRKCKSLIFNGANTIIDISDLPDALYLISIENEFNTYTKKIYKVR